MRTKALLTVLMCSVALIASAGVAPSGYYKSECKDEVTTAKVASLTYVYFHNDSIIIKDAIKEQCCAEFELKISGVISDTIYVTLEDTTSQQCDCMCFHDVEINAGKIPSKDVVVSFNGQVFDSINEYMYPLVEVGKEWYVDLFGGSLWYRIESDLPHAFCWNGKYYYHLLSDELYPVKSSYSKYIREENGKVYITYQSPSKTQNCDEFLIYDFTAAKGDIIEVGNPNEMVLTLTVDSVKYIKYNDDKLRKTLYLTGDMGSYTWIEGIGNVKDPFSYWEPATTCKCVKSSQEMGTLVCCYEKDELVYKNSNYAHCIISSASDVNTYDIMIYPNPVSDNMYVQGIDGKQLYYTIANVNGAIVLQGDLEEQNYIDLPSGIYVISVNDGDEIVKLQKLVVE